MTRLIIEALTVRCGERSLLADVSLTVAPGELVALVGPNGAGKSTLLRAAVGLLVPSGGRVRIGDRGIRALPPRARAALLAWLPQQAQVTEPMTVLEHVAAARFRFGEGTAKARAGAARALHRVNASELGARRLGTLSGGERQRVALATVLAQEAPLLLLDEPANHLDPRHQRETFRLIGRLADEGHGVLCVTHDIGLLAGLPRRGSTRVVGLSAGRLTFDLALDDPALPERLGTLFELPVHLVEHEQQRALVTFYPRDSQRPPATGAPPCA